MAKFAKGQSGNPNGRRAGVPNKTTQSVKAMILEVTEGMGGAEALLTWARDNAGDFYTKMLTRLIPTEASVTVEDVSDPHRLTNEQLAHIASGGSLLTTPAPDSHIKPH